LEKELSITVSFIGQKPVVYQFHKFPVRVGRSAKCDLAICHEAIPRELCLAWLEEDGSKVRIEERPGLTNPLKKGARTLNGGIEGRQVELSAGPVALAFAPASIITQHQHRTSIRLYLIASVVALCLLGITLNTHLGKTSKRLHSVDRLPSTPLCAVEAESCAKPESCIEKARLLATRARAIISSHTNDEGSTVRAASMLHRAARLYSSVNHQEASSTAQEAASLSKAANDNYNRDITVLRLALRNSSKLSARNAARRLLDQLKDCNGEFRPQLEELAASPARKEE
jgi:hypothetical protein